MVITDINIMLIDIFTVISIRKKMIKQLSALFIIISLSSCSSISPGMHMETNDNWVNNESYVYIDSIDRSIKVEEIKSFISIKNYNYKIGKGDQVAITIWGLPDIFPLSNINPEQNLRRVDSNGNIFFPYVGVIKAEGKTQDELRIDIANSLANFFKDPQLDLSIVKFNSQRIYLLGEVARPIKINITDIPLSLSDALGQSKGINNNTANGSEVFVIRQPTANDGPRVFRVDMSSPAGFISAGNFYLADNDIVYVNAKGTARWNRVISQFFPFSSFLNSVSNLTDGN
tara:strand:- start:85 stop:945 length:861 start_codon:yes stop_codon:yes gene_type:complete